MSSPTADQIAAAAGSAASAPLSAEEIFELKAGRAVSEDVLRVLFHEARTANGFLDRPVPRELLERALSIALMGPTSANSLPMRVVFVESAEAKERLRPALSPTNVDKTMAAPATAIIAADLKFFEQFPRTFPERAELFQGMYTAMPAEKQRAAAWDNALLQMGYFTIALRAVGLDAGPMGGFDREKTDAAFFPDGQYVSQYLINIGYADDTKIFPRLPRFNVSEIARFD